MAKPSISVPAFKLYGESAAWPAADLMHCESIAERSSLHDWEIKPHRHVDLFQILYVRKGIAELQVEDNNVHSQVPIVQVVPALSIHTFSFSSDVEGYILTFASPILQSLPPSLESEFSRPLCLPAQNEVDHLDWLFGEINAEHQQGRSGRELALHSLINLLIVWITRHAAIRERNNQGGHERGLEHLQAFTTLLDENYRQHWPISHYAKLLGISTNHLNAICRRRAGQSALQMINDRLLLESKRCLVYTEMTITQVSDSLGFSDPAYFSRFFKKAVGASPRDFRDAKH
ncbi:helix-turn-helix domain-containing protein [Pseudomonas juntendi]|uniref:Helix-turn-helix domain-containing protein n=1 Tax=Pseudomonas juntendi TaxID=2666183 RepID=A0ABZ2JPI7_9PSED|nr:MULTISPECIES: helix-turn-helix domain-containing protein [Pseudomonas]EGB98961.2 AraC family transcriptional regulator [Pseudomonas sp. TJI-51]MBA6123436.1 helix-turn-helix domain-containing protein [Pseudomonas juntendi]MBH3371961.1 helix-turn-helix domain-containing protein [Pseudomonas juntendi]MBI6916323.1 helix-turn-helix domain-containing protein [Pseudomonas juntendi]MBS6038208.1 helix-turn-helix domain-containing protein [Pseudomonas sp.]